MLSTGIKLFIDAGREPSGGRIFVNDGIEFVHEDKRNFNGMYYLPNHYKARKQWRTPTREELTILMGEPGTFCPTDDIQLFRLPDEIIYQLKNLGIANALDRKHLAVIANSNIGGFKNLNESINQLVRSIRKEGGSYKYRGLYFSPMNLETTGYNDNRELVGLHIDNSVGYNQFITSPTLIRFCINLGKEDRFFLFINKTISQALQLIAEYENIEPADYTDSDLLKKLIKYYPNYPVVKVRQRPYDVYLMPADNVIHDGSTEGSSSVDITMTFLGDFTFYGSQYQLSNKTF